MKLKESLPYDGALRDILVFAVLFFLATFTYGFTLASGFGWGTFWTAVAAIGTTSAFIFAAWVYSQNSQDEHSRVISEKAAGMLAEAYLLLVDNSAIGEPKNNRMQWIRSARLILEAESLIASCPLTERYRIAYNLEKERWKHEIRTLLDCDPKYDSLRPSFFYGASNWRKDPDLDTVAASCSETIAERVDRFTCTSRLEIKELSPVSVRVIYDFIKFPDDYLDPLESVEIWTREELERRSIGFLTGAERYVLHRHCHIVHQGKCMTVEDFDELMKNA